MNRRTSSSDIVFSIAKLKVELWALLLILAVFFLAVMVQIPGEPARVVKEVGSADAGKVEELEEKGQKVKNLLYECEERATKTKLYLADKLAELAKMKLLVEDYEAKNQLVGTNQDSKAKTLEREIRKLKQELKDLETQLSDPSKALDSSRQQILEGSLRTVLRRTLEVANYLPTYDMESIGTNPAYNVTGKLDCWALNCLPENLNNKDAYTECSIETATTWNALGVKNMERFVSIPKEYPKDTQEHQRLLEKAKQAFTMASELDPTCSRATINLALVSLQLGDPGKALGLLGSISELEKGNAKYWAIFGYIHDILGNDLAAETNWNKALEIEPLIGERKYFGIMLVPDLSPKHHFQSDLVREINPNIETPAVTDILTFIEFSPVSIANYVTLPPDTQELFVARQYSILRDILPPFVLHSAANSYKQLREGRFLHLGDHQSKRHSAYNCRVGRILQYQLVDVIRRVTVHNVKPTYVFFGGYIEGAKLPPHTDKPQCEFTVTLTLAQYPIDSKPWTVSLGSKAKFDRDDSFIGDPEEPLPPENEIVNADLYPGDCLLFMGRHHVHFRTDPLPEGQILDQIFIHHVQENFPGPYDI